MKCVLLLVPTSSSCCSRLYHENVDVGVKPQLLLRRGPGLEWHQQTLSPFLLLLSSGVLLWPQHPVRKGAQKCQSRCLRRRIVLFFFFSFSKKSFLVLPFAASLFLSQHATHCFLFLHQHEPGCLLWRLAGPMIGSHFCHCISFFLFEWRKFV